MRSTTRGTFVTAATLFLTAGTGLGIAAADDGTEIRFPAGGTSQTVSGSLAVGGEDTYTFDARAGQSAAVHFTRTSDTERWTLVGPKGNPLHNGMTEQQTDVTTELPNSGTYRIDVQATDAGDYTLQLSITDDGSTSGGQVSQVPAGAADTGGGATGGIEDAGLLGAGAAALAAAGGIGAVAARRRRAVPTS